MKIAPFFLMIFFLSACKKEPSVEEERNPSFIFDGAVIIDSVPYKFEAVKYWRTQNTFSFLVYHYKNGVYSLGFDAVNIPINDTTVLDSSNSGIQINLSYGKGDAQYSFYDPILNGIGYTYFKEIDNKNYQVTFDSKMYCFFGPGCLLYGKPSDTIHIQFEGTIVLKD